MSFEYIDDQIGGRGECLAEKLDAVFGGFAVSDVAQELIESRTDVRGNLGQVTCKAAGCNASCVIRVSEGEVDPTLDELGQVSDACKEMKEAVEGLDSIF